MRSFVAVALLFCASSLLAEDSKKIKKLPLHQHPTLVQMLEQSNALRESQGLAPHRMSAELTEAAQDHARFMARTGYFDHYVNGGHIARAERHDYHGMVRENIAMGYRTVDQTFEGWRYSSGHWASIVSDTVDAGFGYAIAEDGTQYWVGVYGYGSPQTTDQQSAE